MSAAAAPPTGYDRIAHLYDVDMAASMRFDDVAYYARIAGEAPGPTLELGCGNGRVLLALLERGIDAVGADASAAMLAALRAKAAARSLRAPVARMDVRALSFASRFGAVLCPYSLVTYMTSAADAAAMLGEARRVLVPGGVLALDAFIPRAAAMSDEYRIDYERAFGEGSLVRSKRIRALAPSVNRIERRYEIRDAARALVERIETSEDIRAYTPAELEGVATRAGFAIVARAWDYGATASADDAQFVTLVARRAPLVA